MLEALDREQYLLSGFHPNIVFERAWFLMGMNRLLSAMVEDKARGQEAVPPSNGLSGCNR